jgi:hypothetical protein
MPAVITRRPAPPSPAPPSPVPSSRPAVAIALCLVALLCFASPSARAVATKLTPQILIGVPQPVVGAPITVDVLVEGAADTAPLATGNITIHWGDETPTSVAALSNSLITAQHTYAKSAAYTVTASYPGDSNYLSASTTQAIIVVPTTPSAVTLNTFGDSITYGRGATEPQYAWADITAATEGWALNDTGIRGDFSIDTCAIINSNEPLPASAHNTLFDGENDLPHVFASAAGQAEYISAMTSCAVWLATTQGANRTTAASSANSLTGTWTPSTLYTSTGLNSTAAGSTISGSFTGNVFYAQLTSTAATNDSVSISIDSAAATTYSPPLLAYHGQRATYGPYFIRIPLTGSNSSTHSVKFTCVTPGAAGCYVDWFAGNGLISPASPPYLWLATPYITDQTNYPLNEFLQLATFMRNIQLELSADGLPVYLTDVANWFQAPTNPTCMFDTIHPNDCGHAILAATFINSMNVLLPASFKSDATAALSAIPDSAILGQSVTLTATVTGSAATPTGIATFSYDGIALAAVPLQGLDRRTRPRPLSRHRLLLRRLQLLLRDHRALQHHPRALANHHHRLRGARLRYSARQRHPHRHRHRNLRPRQTHRLRHLLLRNPLPRLLHPHRRSRHPQRQLHRHRPRLLRHHRQIFRQLRRHRLHLCARLRHREIAAPPPETRRHTQRCLNRPALASQIVFVFGAEEGTRTPTPLRVHGPEPCASANSATSASRNLYSLVLAPHCQTPARPIPPPPRPALPLHQNRLRPLGIPDPLQ